MAIAAQCAVYSLGVRWIGAGIEPCRKNQGKNNMAIIVRRRASTLPVYAWQTSHPYPRHSIPTMRRSSAT